MHSIRKITSLNVFFAHFFAVKSLGQNLTGGKIPPVILYRSSFFVVVT